MTYFKINALWVVHYIGVCFLLFLPVLGTAQQEPIFSFYRQQLNLVNPAVAGLDLGSVTLVHRSQWTDIPDAPETTAFSFGTPWGKGLGGGLSVWNGKTFVEQQTFVSADFSYKVKLGETHNLFMGLKAGGDFYRVSLTGLETFNAVADPALADISRFTPNAGLGFYLEHERYFISVSAPRLFDNKRAKEEDGVFFAATNALHYYISAGATLPLGTAWSFLPTGILRHVGGAPISAEVTGMLSFRDRLRFGAGYRTAGTLSGLVMVGITDTFHLGYAYDADRQAGLVSVGGNSHELLVQFKLGKKTVPEKEGEIETVPEQSVPVEKQNDLF